MKSSSFPGTSTTSSPEAPLGGKLDGAGCMVGDAFLFKGALPGVGPGDDGNDATPPAMTEDGGGCGCSTGRSGTRSGAVAILLLAAALVMRATRDRRKPFVIR